MSTGELSLIRQISFFKIWWINEFGGLRKTGLLQSCEVHRNCTAYSNLDIGHIVLCTYL